ncbi:bifunctional sulfate adenylyltransferase/adenylylsulfate kinase [Sulfuricaulis sp.]|jgi:sulfate adenylyltransferase|uniref:bifunctional sulfate adenylyltransferase/adenylylsulfate kinase n=1 Tax=Sulfuricaulis sp. TaxID=2003553 RepID=UPI003559D287
MSGIHRLGTGRELNSPYGGALVNLLVSTDRSAELKAASCDLVSLDLTPRQLSDFEMLATGAFSPLTSFMGRADYEAVCARMRMADGRFWPIPVTLDVPQKFAESLSPGQAVALRDAEGTLMAVLTVTEVWQPDKGAEAQFLYGTRSVTHAAASHLLNVVGDAYIAGKLEVVELPVHHDFALLRQAPAVVRALLHRHAANRVVGYQPRHLIHRTHVEFTKRAAFLNDATLLIQAAVGRNGMSEPDHYSRVRALRAVLEHYSTRAAHLNLIELSPHHGGPRAALWHAILSKNFGCSHFIMEHDYDDQGEGATGEPLYGKYRALESVLWHAHEIGIEVVPFRNLVQEEDQPERFLSGGRVGRRAKETPRLASDQKSEIAHWFSYPTVLEEWRKTLRQGFTIFFTGLSGAGKSTLAQVVYARLKESEARPVTLLDGDVVRKHLSSELGFSREHRDTNVMRQGYVASLITSHGGIALCAPIAPYAHTRTRVRAMIEEHGDFIEIHVATPLEVCESRDRKGLYARARAGLIKNFTGVSDPYESPTNAEIVIDTTLQSAHEAADKIVAYLVTRGYLVRPAPKVGANGDKTKRDPATLWTQSSGAVVPLSGLAGMEGQPVSPDTPRR